jgi:hypothetical protein
MAEPIKARFDNKRDRRKSVVQHLIQQDLSKISDSLRCFQIENFYFSVVIFFYNFYQKFEFYRKSKVFDFEAP